MATAAELKARLLKYAKPIPAAGVSPSSGEIQNIPPAESRVAENSIPVAVEVNLQPTTLVVVERPVAETNSAQGLASSVPDEATNLDISNPVHQSFLQRLHDVEVALLNRDPLMKTHLGAIHKTMLEYEEIANLLRPEEIAKIMAAQQAHTGIVLRAETVGKSKQAASKKAASLGLADI